MLQFGNALKQSHIRKMGSGKGASLFILLLCLLLWLSGCSGQSLEKANAAIGDMKFTDESILTQEEKNLLESLRSRREEALQKKDVKSLEAVKADWDSMKEPIEAFIKTYEGYRSGFFTDLNLLTEGEKEWFRTAEGAVTKAYRARDKAGMDAANEILLKSGPSSLRNLIRSYKGINQKPFKNPELNLMSSEERKAFQALINDTNTALLERDTASMEALSRKWSGFAGEVKSGMETAKNKLIQDFVKGSSFGSALGSLFSMGQVSQNTSVNGHEIIITNQYTTDAVSDKQIQSAMDTYLGLMSSTLQSGVNQMGAYVEDVRVRLEYKNNKDKVIASKTFSPSGSQTVTPLWTPAYPEQLVPEKGMDLWSLAPLEGKTDPGSSESLPSSAESLPQGSTEAPSPSSVAPTEETVPATTEPATEPATETPGEEESEPETGETILVGDYVSFGRYEQDGDSQNGTEEIQWIVTASEGDYVDLISRYILDLIPFHKESVSVNYAKSDINEFLNTHFMEEAFSAEDQSFLIPVSFQPSSNPEYPQTEQGRAVLEMVWLPSLEDAVEFFGEADSLRCPATSYAKSKGLYVDKAGNSPWWTGTMGQDNTHAALIYPSGQVYYKGVDVSGAPNYDIGIRPCIRVLRKAVKGVE